MTRMAASRDGCSSRAVYTKGRGAGQGTMPIFWYFLIQFEPISGIGEASHVPTPSPPTMGPV